MLNLTNRNNPFVEHFNDLSNGNNFRNSSCCWQENDFDENFEMETKIPNSLSDSSVSRIGESGVQSDNSEQFYEKENEKGWSSPSTPAHNNNAQRLSNEASAWVNFSNL